MGLFSSIPQSKDLSVLHLYSLFLFSIHSTLGRYKLARYLGISDLLSRTLIQNLTTRNLLELASQQRGHQLSSEGKRIWKRIEDFLWIPSTRIHLDKFTVGEKDAIVCINAQIVDFLSTVKLRDTALLNGAFGCTIFLSEHNKIYLLDSVYPPLPEKSFSNKEARNKLLRLLAPLSWEKIIIIAGTGQNVLQAQIGALGAALSLFPSDLKQKL